MTVVLQFKDTDQADERLREEFFGWQCRVRQIAMRNADGRPDDAIMPEILLSGVEQSIGRIITVICKKPAFSQTPELQHLARKTSDAAERRTKGIEFLSSTYYQKPAEFSDTLTATFVANSAGAKAICESPGLSLVFEAYGQRFTVFCRAKPLAPGSPLYQATWWHNFLFNPGLSPQTIVVGFQPDWAKSAGEMLN